VTRRSEEDKICDPLRNKKRSNLLILKVKR